MRVQLVIAPHDESRSWTVLDDDLDVVGPIESFLAHMSAVCRSPNTVRAYAHDLKDFFTYCRACGLDWDRVSLEDVGRFIPWLGLSDEARHGGTASVPIRAARCAPVTVNRKLSAVSSFYQFHARNGVGLAESMQAWQRQSQVASSWAPFLAHLGNHPVRKRVISLKTDRLGPQVLPPEQVDAVIGACVRLRDRFLFTLLRTSGLRIGEALGLRHEDLNPRRCEVTVWSRINTNHARAKSRSRVVPVPAAVLALYSDYLHEEYGPLGGRPMPGPQHAPQRSRRSRVVPSHAATTQVGARPLARSHAFQRRLPTDARAESSCAVRVRRLTTGTRI